MRRFGSEVAGRVRQMVVGVSSNDRLSYSALASPSSGASAARVAWWVRRTRVSAAYVPITTLSFSASSSRR